ncbi:MAG: IS200/IS605 family element transposase accessory protein TnpB [Planctomycetes bacterium]|nr:IS200/IS605 family element transposase accessory protein TnpB [Planctomycetota bacterium]
MNDSPVIKNKRHVKVLRLRILKPVSGTWQDLAKLLRDTRYRVYRLANLAVSEAYLGFHMWRTGRAETYELDTPGALNRRLRRMLDEEGVRADELDRFSKTGALPDTVVGALSQYKIRAATGKSKWQEVIRGKSSLPTYRLDMAIPLRCDKRNHARLARVENGDVTLDLMLCLRPYPRVVIQTGNIGGGAQAVLDRLLANPSQNPDGYRQRLFEIKHDDRDNKWWLYITYDFPAADPPRSSADRIVGVDIGVSCPIYVAINDGHARLGRRQFSSLGARIRSLQNQIVARRRSMQAGGKVALSGQTSRSGHGRKRKLRPIQKLEGRISHAYTTLNHQLSSSVIDFALSHGARVIQMEDLASLKDALRGTFIGARWRYHQLQQFLEYKAKESGLTLRKINPQFTSRRCSRCGFIHVEFDRARRDASRRDGYVARFVCPAPKCGFEADPDYNAARNIATPDIEKLISDQCKIQSIPTRSLTDQSEAADKDTLAQGQSRSGG